MPSKQSEKSENKETKKVPLCNGPKKLGGWGRFKKAASGGEPPPQPPATQTGISKATAQASSALVAPATMPAMPPIPPSVLISGLLQKKNQKMS